MRRATHRWGRGLALAAALLPAARAQTVPVAPVPVVRPVPAAAAAPASTIPLATPASTVTPALAAPAGVPGAPAAAGKPATAGPPAAKVRTDTLRPVPTATPTFVADTARRVVVVNPAEPTNEVTRRTGLRIGAVILIITLTTLLLYNVRSR